LHKKLVTTLPEESVAEAFEKMNKHDIGRLLVVSKENKETLLGILTRSDIIHALRT
jgi:CBS domain-containing protein